MPSKKLLGAAALSASLFAGGVTGALWGAPIVSSAQEKSDDETRHGPLAHHGGLRGAAIDLEVAAGELGLSEDELRDALHDGRSIADIAGERNVDVQNVIDALVADATANIEEQVTAIVNGEGPLGHARFDRHGPGLRLGAFDVAAEVLGMTEEELHDELRGGESLAAIADQRDVDVQAVIDALVADATTRIDDAVADGDLDADKAAELKERLIDRVTRLVNMEPGTHIAHGRLRSLSR